jgi:HD-GYP domain-containing protein (c-di-GMP phosphodiesterase class II)
VLAAEPGGPHLLPTEWLDTAVLVCADFVDLKSEYTAQHSRRVAELAAAAARRLGLGDAPTRDVWRAGLLHDLGRVTVSAGVWDAPRPLTEAEREKVRLHAYYTERICTRTSALAGLGTLAGLHHERLDGSGYHRAARASMLAPAARVLGAADAFQAMTERRPYRPALAPLAAAEELQRDADAGRLDRDAVRAVIESAGQQPRRERRAGPFGLTDREIEVLTWLARGWPTKEIARRLVVSPKTVEHHIQHIFEKLDVRSRAGARVFAAQHGLIDDGAF